ncbi:hypothetical protein JCM8547_008517 [Rhodosporidiobolus lusitaniae]
MAPTLDSFIQPSSSKRPPSPSADSSSPRKKLASSTPRSTKKSTGGSTGTSEFAGGPGGKGKGKLEELVLDDSDEDDLIIVEPDNPVEQPVASMSKGTTTGGKKKPETSTPKKAQPPVASIFQRKAPASPVTGFSPKSNKAKGKEKEKETFKAEGIDLKVEDEEDSKPDVKPDIKPSPLKTLSFFDTSAAKGSSSSPSTSSASSSAPGAGDATVLKPLDMSLFSFDPLRDVTFPRPPNLPSTSDPPVPFSFFTSALLLISSTKSRLLIRLVLTNLLRSIIVHSPSSLLSVLYLLSNRIAPSYEKGKDLGVGWQVLSKAIKETSGASAQKLKQLSNAHGDPGDIAFEASKSVRLLVRPKELTCEGVYSILRAISKLKGTGVLNQKTSLVKKLLLSARGEEVRYVVRLLVQNLRIGAVRLTLLTALARAFCLAVPGGEGEEKEGDVRMKDEEDGGEEGGTAREYWITPTVRLQLSLLDAPSSPSTSTSPKKGKKAASKPAKNKSSLELAVEARFAAAEKVVRRVYARHPNLGHVVEALMEGAKEGKKGGAGAVGGLEERVGVSVGIPLEPMLGSITRSLSDIYPKLHHRPFVSEAKLDGQRGQIHVWVTDSSPSSFLPPGAEEGAGIVYEGKPLEGLEGRRVWVRTFSRHLEDMSEKYPDIVATMAAMVARSFTTATNETPPLRNFILDCEVVAIDPVSGAFKTFQELSYRSKKDVELGDIKVRVGVYAFDLMFLNDESLLSTPFRLRRSTLHTLFPSFRPSDPRLAKFELIPSCESNDPDDVREFFEECVRMKAEGIMVKLLDEVEVEVKEEDEEREGEKGEEDEEAERASGSEAEEGRSRSRSGSLSAGGSGSELEEDVKPSFGKGKGNEVEGKKAGGKGGRGGRGKGSRRKVLPATYEPDKRADSWCKVKKDYLEDLGDSLDLVPIAAWHGQGRKAGWWSPFLLACYDEETGTYTAVTKCLSGFTDAFYKEYKAKYSEDPENPLTSKTCWPEVEGGGLRPDIWFKPSEVWEIRGADFTLSPVYPAARSLLGGERGVSVRFPRMIKVRDDKGIENATTAEQLAELYEKQARPAAGGGGGKVAAGEEGEDEE